MSTSSTLQLSTQSLHADDAVCPARSGDVAPPLHLSTTFLYNNAEKLIYSRDDTPTRLRLEAVLTALEKDATHSLAYSSGLAAAYAIVRCVRPKRVLYNRGYHGVHAIFKILEKEGVQLIPFPSLPVNRPSASATTQSIFTGDPVDIDWAALKLQKQDLIWLETPCNPTGICLDIQRFSQTAHQYGAFVAVDATFASPILQHSLALGADFVMHSATKYLGGHSDLLAGVVSVKSAKLFQELKEHRVITGNTIGALEAWLLLRSLRTVELRVKQQSKSACQLAAYLSTHPSVSKVWHTSLSTHPDNQLACTQMLGHPGVLSVEFATPDLAQNLSNHTKLFKGATSLGGVESLLDYRYKWDTNSHPCLVRISVGLEDVRDLIADLEQAFVKSSTVRSKL